MTQKTKLEIIGPYTPEHPGPFCTRDGKSVRLITKTEGAPRFPVVGLINNASYPAIWFGDGRSYLSPGPTFAHKSDLMNAREVPVAREFWIVEYFAGNISAFENKEDLKIEERAKAYLRTIHVREVLPGDEA